MFVTIPTRFDRPTVVPLVESASQVATVILVHTEPGHPDLPNAVNVHDYSRSIQHWWNTGLDLCDGPTLVLNDDIVAAPSDLQLMFDALADNDIVYLAGHRIGHATPLTGWCYGIRPDVIRPDNAFGWWYGEDDLYRRAVRDGLTVAALNIPTIEHHRMEAAFAHPEHAQMASEDAVLFAQRWP